MATAQHVGKVVITRQPPAFRIRSDGAYLVSGGLSGVGLEVARWLAKNGAGRLILFGRRGETPEASEAIGEMRRAGADVWIEALDGADRVALTSLLERIRSGGLPLRGVIHAAGLLDNAALANQNSARFMPVFRAKVETASALDELTRLDPLELFVLCSSLASVLGAPGQTNYAAANAYLDALAHDRRRQGLPALSVNWGAWSVGTAKEAAAHIAARGLGVFEPSCALAALSRLLESGATQNTIAVVDWPSYAKSAGAERSALLRDLLAGVAAPSAISPASTKSARKEIEKAPVERRSALIMALVAREAAVVAGLAPERSIDPRVPLRDLGLDSLMAVDLRNRLSFALDKRFPATLLFDHPTLAALASFLGEEVFGLALTPAAPKQSDGSESLIEEIENLSDDAIDLLIAAKKGAAS
jgi:NAD(P)-dependent dehydrogenase (short-subunit alcohol dehydrogenase family)